MNSASSGTFSLPPSLFISPHTLTSSPSIAGKSTSDLSHVIPLKKQQGFLNMAGQMITTLGPKLLPHLPRVVSIIIHLGTASSDLLDVRHLVSHATCLSQFYFPFLPLFTLPFSIYNNSPSFFRPSSPPLFSFFPFSLFPISSDPTSSYQRSEESAPVGSHKTYTGKLV